MRIISEFIKAVMVLSTVVVIGVLAWMAVCAHSDRLDNPPRERDFKASMPLE